MIKSSYGIMYRLSKHFFHVSIVFEILLWHSLILPCGMLECELEFDILTQIYIEPLKERMPAYR
jgi:hypothetical protein